MSSSSNRHALAPTVAQRDADYRYSQQLTNLLNEITELNKTIGETAAEHRRQSIPPCEISIQARAMTCLNTKVMWITYKLDPIIKVDAITAERMSRMFPEIAEFFKLD
ncbi:unnamed protein product [Alternaria alternata]